MLSPVKNAVLTTVLAMSAATSAWAISTPPSLDTEHLRSSTQELLKSLKGGEQNYYYYEEDLSASDQVLYQLFAALSDLQASYESRSDHEAEKRILLSGISLIQGSPVLSRLYLGESYLKLADVFIRQRRLPAAEHYIHLAINNFVHNFGHNTSTLAVAYNNLAWVELKQNKTKEAIAHLHTALGIAERTGGKNSWLYKWINENLKDLEVPR